MNSVCCVTITARVRTAKAAALRCVLSCGQRHKRVGGYAYRLLNIPWLSTDRRDTAIMIRNERCLAASCVAQSRVGHRRPGRSDIIDVRKKGLGLAPLSGGLHSSRTAAQASKVCDAAVSIHWLSHQAHNRGMRRSSKLAILREWRNRVTRGFRAAYETDILLGGYCFDGMGAKHYSSTGTHRRLQAQ